MKAAPAPPRQSSATVWACRSGGSSCRLPACFSSTGRLALPHVLTTLRAWMFPHRDALSFVDNMLTAAGIRDKVLAAGTSRLPLWPDAIFCPGCTASADGCLANYQQIAIISSGKSLTGFSLVRNMALGADVCNSARAMMFALGCIQVHPRPINPVHYAIHGWRWLPLSLC